MGLTLQPRARAAINQGCENLITWSYQGMDSRVSGRQESWSLVACSVPQHLSEQLTRSKKNN